MKAGLVLAALCVLAFATPAAGQIAGVYFQDPGARAAGMGGCFVSVADDAWAPAWNPGGLAFLNADISVAGSYQSIVPERDINLWCSGAAVRTKRLGSFAALVEHLTYEEQVHWNPDDPDPGPDTFTPNDLSWSLSYGRALLGHLGAGGTVKRVRVFMFPDDMAAHGSGSVSGWAFDAGVLYRQDQRLGSWDGVLRMGVSVLHMGQALSLGESFDPEDYPLPTRLKAGASYGAVSGQAVRALVCFETTWPIEKFDPVVAPEEHPRIGLGLELVKGSGSAPGPAAAGRSPNLEIAGRIGYVQDDDQELSGMSFGAGAALRTRAAELRVDFASSPAVGEMDRPWQLGCSVAVWH
jgi:hypothetical protein